MIEDFLEKITWLGHDGFRIDGSKTIYIDPYQISPGPSADIILITHEHFDHCNPDDVAKIQKPETVIITEKQSAAKLSGDVRTIQPGESAIVGEIQIQAVPSYNTDKNFHPKENGWLGFIVKVDGISIYHAGDTDVIPEMKSFDVDIALLPVSGTYVMTAEQAVAAALDINPKIAIPMHYGAIVGDATDAETFQNKLAGKVKAIILQKE
jgi:L-ascorbate metabolism protein UlaG (beta-lactamase superfamily)